MCSISNPVFTFFCQQRHPYGEDGAQITFFVQLLCDYTIKWAQTALKANPEIAYSEFLSKFRNVFDKDSSKTAAAHRLLNLKKGRRSMADYSIDFWILTEKTDCSQLSDWMPGKPDVPCFSPVSVFRLPTGRDLTKSSQTPCHTSFSSPTTNRTQHQYFLSLA